VADPGGGIKRESVIDYQKVIPDITNDPIVTHPVVSGQFSSFGVSLTLPLDKTVTMVFAFLHDAGVAMTFGEKSTALRIVLIHEF